MSYKLFLVLMAVLFLFGCATVETPQTKIASASILAPTSTGGTLHVIQKGETLWHVSKIYHTDIETILSLNQLNDSSQIMAGETLIIPKVTKMQIATITNFEPRETSTDFIWPTKGKIATTFKQKVDGVLNKGIEIETGISQDVVASRSGRVLFVGKLPGYGETLIINHEDDYTTIYGCTSTISIKPGDTVQQGFVIAKTSDPFKKGTNVLHFEIRKKHKPQNPLFYLSH